MDLNYFVKLMEHDAPKYASAELLAAMIQAAAIKDVADVICNLRLDHPLMGETFTGIACALESISESLNK